MLQDDGYAGYFSALNCYKSLPNGDRLTYKVRRLSGGVSMTDEKRAELYTSPGGKFIRADSLPRILAHWRSLRPTQKQTHFIKYDGELYDSEAVVKLQSL